MKIIFKKVVLKYDNEWEVVDKETMSLNDHFFSAEDYQERLINLLENKLRTMTYECIVQFVFYTETDFINDKIVENVRLQRITLLDLKASRNG